MQETKAQQSTAVNIKAKGIVYCTHCALDEQAASSYTTRRAVSLYETNHCHDSYEILLLSEGEARCTVEDTVFPMSSGSLMLIATSAYHSMRPKEGTDFAITSLTFRRSDICEEARALLGAMLDDDVNARLYSVGALHGGVLSALERLRGASSLPLRERTLYVQMLVGELVTFLSLSKGERRPEIDVELGARVLRYINENIDQHMTLERIARHFFVSKYYLCRAFKKHNGISIHGYMNQKRVLMAKQLIEAGQTASGAAYRVGFGDYSAFYRAYVKVVGKPPSAS